MKTNFKVVEGTLIAALNGELDHHCATEVREKIEKEILRSGVKNIIFDFTCLDFMDSSGIGVIIGRFKYFEKLGGETIICGINPQVDRLINISGLKKIIPVYDTVDEALKHV